MEAGSNLSILYFFMMAFISELHGYDTDGSTSTPHSSHTFTMFSLPMTRRSSAMVKEHEYTPVQGPALREQRACCKVSKGLTTRKGRAGEG
ncbi:hypothetical protein QOT17_014852 [Balamuthia mandrillaris]